MNAAWCRRSASRARSLGHFSRLLILAWIAYTCWHIGTAFLRLAESPTPVDVWWLFPAFIALASFAGGWMGLLWFDTLSFYERAEMYERKAAARDVEEARAAEQARLEQIRRRRGTVMRKRSSAIVFRAFMTGMGDRLQQPEGRR